MENSQILAIITETHETQIALYQNTNLLFLRMIKHPDSDLQKFDSIYDQLEYRTEHILDELNNADIDLNKIELIMARGGLLKPIHSGIYQVNENMKNDLKDSQFGTHSINLGGLIADRLLETISAAKAFIADPVAVDELDDIARYTGLPSLKHESVFHALSQKATARRHAKISLKNYEDLNLLVAHLGEGISIGAHRKGKVVDVNQTFDGGGPFSLVRSGTLPVGTLVKLAFSGKYNEQQMLDLLRNKSGMLAHTGTADLYTIEKRVNQGDPKVTALFEAMAYQVAKYIGFMSPVLKGKIDGILLTGELAHSKKFINLIIERISFIAPVFVYPGECLCEALAAIGLEYLKGEIEVQQYK